MAVRVAINGFGRIGRLTLRAALNQGARILKFVAINDLGSVDMNARLLQYDTMHGKLPRQGQSVTKPPASISAMANIRRCSRSVTQLICRGTSWASMW